MRAMPALIVATIVLGLVVDRHGGAWGPVVVSAATWAVLAALWRRESPDRRPFLLACLLFATAGEVFLSLVWGLYDYRRGGIPLFVPPGHVLLFWLGMHLAGRPDEATAWAIALLALPVVATLATLGHDTLGPLLYALFLACMAGSRSRRLYATMLLASLAMELWGTWLGNWAWRREVPFLPGALVTGNPPLAAGAFYAMLDLLVVASVSAWRAQSPASPILTPSTPSHQAATCSARSSSR